MLRTITEQMNSDMFDNICSYYSIKEFSNLERSQAIESFAYNGFKATVCGDFLNITK